MERAVAADADLIAVTGDFIDGAVSIRRADVEPLRGLRARDGVWAITGNHEYFFGAANWVSLFRDMGIRVLMNEYTTIWRSGAVVVLAGLADLSARVPEPRHDLDAALAGAPDGAPILLLDHQPRGAQQAAVRGVAVRRIMATIGAAH